MSKWMKIRRRCKAHGKTGKQKLNSVSNKQKAIKLRSQGKSFQEIAKALGVAVGTAYNYVSSGIEEINEQCKNEAKQLRRVELIRLDRLWKVMERDFKRTRTKTHKIDYIYDKKKDKMVKKVLDKLIVTVNYSARMAIVDRMLAIMQERRKYIPGLEVPKESKLGLGFDEDQRNEFMQAQQTLEKKLAMMAGIITPDLPALPQPSAAIAPAAEEGEATNEDKEEKRTIH